MNCPHVSKASLGVKARLWRLMHEARRLSSPDAMGSSTPPHDFDDDDDDATRGDCCLECDTPGCYSHSLRFHRSSGEIVCATCNSFVAGTETDAVRSHALYDKRRRLTRETEEARNDVGDAIEIPVGTLGLRGLVNLGNTCFMNSVLQVVTQVPELRDHFLSGRHRETCSIIKLAKSRVEEHKSLTQNGGLNGVRHHPASTVIANGEGGYQMETQASRYLSLWGRPWDEDHRDQLPDARGSGVGKGGDKAKTSVQPTGRAVSPAFTSSSSPPPPASSANVTVPICFGCEIEALLGEAYCASNAVPFTPQSILQSLWAHSRSLAAYQQQDAQEFFSALINTLHSHTCDETMIRENAPLAGLSPGASSPRPPPNFLAHLASPSSVDRFGSLSCTCVAHVAFGGVLKSELKCSSCHQISPSYEPFFDISLQIPHLSYPTTTSSATSVSEEAPSRPMSSGGATPDCGCSDKKKEGGEESAEWSETSPRSSSTPATRSASVDGTETRGDGQLRRGPPRRGREGYTGASVTSCLDSFISAERLEGTERVTCDSQKCRGVKREFSKQMSIQHAPNVLVLHIKRFESRGVSAVKKIDSRVDFPLEGLDLRKYVSGSTRSVECECGWRVASSSSSTSASRGAAENAGDGNGQPGEGESVHPEFECQCFTYDLLGFVQHMGEYEGGHYVAVARVVGGGGSASGSGEEAWIQFDDSFVSRVDREAVEGMQPYLLFYRRRRRSGRR